MIDIDISDEEIKLANKEIEEKFMLDDPYQIDDKFSAREAKSPTPLRDDMMDFVDQFHDLNDGNDENERKEVTNMPLANPEFDSNLYETKGYSSKQVSNSKALLQNSKTNKDSVVKYYDPYVDRHTNEKPVSKAKPRRDQKGDSKGSANTDNEQTNQMNKKKVEIDEGVGWWGKKKCIIF